jgi:lipoprotein-anchoring transpeptidase ErfK/SrfK
MALPLRRARRRVRVVGVVVAALVLGLSAACGARGVGAQWQANGNGDPSSPQPGAAQLVITPVANAKDISPADPIRVEVTDGTLESVKVTNPTGKEVKGGFDAEKRTWSSSEPLGYNKKYTVAVAGTGVDGQRVEQTTSFTTVKPKEFTLPYLRANGNTLLDGRTFGVGQPIVVWWDESIEDRAAAERTLSVTTDPPVVGAWHWFDKRELHWRPEKYWPAGTKVTVEAKAYGRHFGNGLYGQEDRKATFTIGRSKIAIADAKTFRMKVYVDGAQVRTINGKDVTQGIPVSMGKNSGERGEDGQWIDFRTTQGVHVVTTKDEVYRMTSASYGITDPESPNFYDERIKKAVRISGSGVFVHLADWNIPSHGVRNTSHGCINVAPTYIYWFYNTFGAGDVVEVRNTGYKLNVRDGLGDWVMPWNEWLKGSALS